MKTQFTTHARIVPLAEREDRFQILLDNGTVIVGFGIEDGMTREECRRLLEEIASLTEGKRQFDSDRLPADGLEASSRLRAKGSQ